MRLTCVLKPRQPGFTLLESLITVFLVMLVFGLVAELLLGAFRVTRFERQKIAALEAAQLALSRMTAEIRESCKLEFPNAPKELVLYKVNPTYNLAMGSETNRYKYLLKVRYYLDNQGTLLRDVEELPGGTTASHVVADGIAGINVAPSTAPTSKNVLIDLTVDVKGQLRQLSTEVDAPAVL